MEIQPYLSFNGRCEEAIEFYKEKLGAEVVMLIRFNEAPQSLEEMYVPKEFAEKVMHATLSIEGAIIMASDGCSSEAVGYEGIAISIGLNNVEKGRKLFDGLAEGGIVQMPFEKTFWALGFGMVKDKFGHSWMVNVE